MNPSDLRIMIVEDELTVADDIQNCLQNLGYSVVATVSSGEQSIKKAQELRPDLVLMDIILKKEMNGIQTAEIVQREFNIPVIYLTAYSDKKTLDRANVTTPYGYIVKPFNEKDLYNAIEMTLYINRMEKKVKKSENKFRLLYENNLSMYFTVDPSGLVVSVNSLALNS